MGKSNVEVVEGAYEAFGRGDIPTVLGLLTDDVAWHAPETLVHGGTFKGTGEVVSFFEGLGGAWDGLSLEVEGVAPLGADQVAAVLRASGTRRSSGAVEGYGAVHVFTVRDGRIAAFCEYVDLDRPLT